MRMRPAAADFHLRGPAFAGWMAGAVLLSAVPCGGALAQDTGGSGTEVPLGTFTLRPSQNGFSVVEPPAGTPGVDRGLDRDRHGSDDGDEGVTGRWFFQGVDTPSSADLAQSLYNDARKALDAGRPADAQRLLERLIAEAPDSPLAGEARQHLGRLYRAVETGVRTETTVPAPKAAASDAAPRESLPWSENSPSPPPPAAPAPLGVDRPVPREMLMQARVQSVVDDEFLSEAGDRVFFGAGSAELGSRARGVIQAQARFLARHPDISAAVEGHADDGSMSAEETQRLSEKRAVAVRDRLIAEGVEADRLLAFGRGREDRVSDCPAPECLAQNRRVITILLDGHPSFSPHPPRRAQGGRDQQPGSPTQ